MAVETRRPEWRDPEFHHRLKRLVKLARWEREQGHARPLVVILGGSRPQMGLSPEHLGLGAGPTDPLVFSLTQSGTVPVGVRVNLARTLAAVTWRFARSSILRCRPCAPIAFAYSRFC